MIPHVPIEANCRWDISIAPGNRTKVHMLRFHRFLKKRAEDPPGVLPFLRRDLPVGVTYEDLSSRWYRMKFLVLVIFAFCYPESGKYTNIIKSK